MDLPLRDLGNHIARVISAVEGGQRVVLTAHGLPVADVIPRVERRESWPSSIFLANLYEISARAERLGLTSNPSDYETGLTTDQLRSGDALGDRRVD